MDGRMDGLKNRRMDEQMDGRRTDGMDEQTDGRADGRGVSNSMESSKTIYMFLIEVHDKWIRLTITQCPTVKLKE